MADTRTGRHWISLGWAATLLGCAIWTYGYFAGGAPPFIDWAALAPPWVAEYLPNWQAEVGLALAIVGSIPIYYAQIRDYRQRE